MWCEEETSNWLPSCDRFLHSDIARETILCTVTSPLLDHTAVRPSGVFIKGWLGLAPSVLSACVFGVYVCVCIRQKKNPVVQIFWFCSHFKDTSTQRQCGCSPFCLLCMGNVQFFPSRTLTVCWEPSISLSQSSALSLSLSLARACAHGIALALSFLPSRSTRL